MPALFRACLLASAALISQPALAMAASEAAETQTADPSTSVGTGAGDDGQEIIVSARRRLETAQDVPLAISVLGGEHIDNTGSFNVGRLQQLTPSLQYTSSNPRNTTLSIRGIGAPFGLTNDGFEQGVGIYVDDVYYSRAASSTFDFLDVAQIEVLRGPQGTLYGKNTAAGAINITSRQPTFDFEGRAEVTIGSLGFKQAKAAISGPLSDTLAARLAISTTSRRGTLYNLRTGNFINAQDNLGLRAQLLWKPNADLSITLASDYSTQDPECCGTVFVGTLPTQRALSRQYQALAAAQNYAAPSANPFDRLTDLDAALSANNKIGGASLRARWDRGRGTLTSVTAWRFWDWKPTNDRDFTGLPITTKSQNPSQQNQFTQELRYNYSGPRYDFVVGLFGFHQKVRTQGTEQLGAAASRWLINPVSALASDPGVLNGVTALNDIRLDNTSAALFGQFSWKVTDRLTVQPGLRVNYDQKDGLYERRVFTGQGQPVLFADTLTGEPIIDPRIVAARDQLTPQRIQPRFSALNFSWDLNVSYKLTPSVLVYATYASTFKSGGINLNGVPNDALGNPQISVAAILPERINHFELGIKTRFLDDKLTANFSAFRTDIRNYQALVNSGQVSTTRGYLANADKVRTQGVEADFSLRPSKRFNFYANGAYTDAKYVSFAGAPCPPELAGGGSGLPIAAAGTPGNSPASCDISGQPLAGVSKWTVSYGAEYNVPASLLGKLGEVYLGYDGNARSRFSSNASPSAYTWIDGYGLSNFRLGFRTEKGIDVYAWVRNAFDQNYFELLQLAPGSTGLIVGNPGDPRVWGGTIKVQF